MPYKRGTNSTLPNPKPAKLTKAQRKAEREARDVNPLKPVYAKKAKSAGLRRTPLKRRTPLRLGRGSFGSCNPLLGCPGKRQRYHVTSSGSAWAERKRKPLRVQSSSENAKERRRTDAEWRQVIWGIWGGCIVTGESRPGHVQAHHMYDKSYRPEWRFCEWNGILLEARTIHPLADTYPEFHKALCEVADECRAAAEGRRPPVTQVEAREVIFRIAPKMRKYANSEET